MKHRGRVMTASVSTHVDEPRQISDTIQGSRASRATSRAALRRTLGRERAGLSASDRFQTGVRPVSDQSPAGLPQSMSQSLFSPCTVHMSSCHVRCTVAVMSDAQKCHVGCTTVSIRMHSLERNSGKHSESGPFFAQKRFFDVWPVRFLLRNPPKSPRKSPSSHHRLGQTWDPTKTPSPRNGARSRWTPTWPTSTTRRKTRR